MKLLTGLLLLLALGAGAPAAAGAPAKAKPKPKGETVITSNRLEYDYQEAVVLFEENVKVQDPQFTMTADRVLVFLEGTNDVRQVRALGNVILVSEGRSARCAQAVYTRADGKIVMTGDAVLQRAKDQIWGKEIVIWVDDQRMECRPARMVLQPQTVQGDGGRLLP
jgi:lipopolysaccharide transport protein LptA